MRECEWVVNASDEQVALYEVVNTCGITKTDVINWRSVLKLAHKVNWRKNPQSKQGDHSTYEKDTVFKCHSSPPLPQQPHWVLMHLLLRWNWNINTCAPLCIEFCVSTEPLVDVLCRLPSARYVDCWGHSVALGSVGHFPSEEQQWIDLWESSLSAECVRSCFPDPVHVLVFFCPRQHTVSTRLYSYENILRQTAAYPVPSSKQWKSTLYQSVTCETKCLQCVGCLSLIKSQ